MILKDLEFVETRLGREPQEAERQAFKKIQALLEQEKFVFNSCLTPEDLSAVATHNFFTATRALRAASRARGVYDLAADDLRVGRVLLQPVVSALLTNPRQVRAPRC